MCLLLRSINCENCKSTEEYFQTHVQKNVVTRRRKNVQICIKRIVSCVLKKLGIEFDREDSGMLFTHIIRKYLSEDEIRILMENNEK